ncbi:hypothetical protein EGH24_04420 [Halonotius terrestris]|uniref:Uncharacterized protein n=1 Tax=Halonotius terrestris TaxID=2487750 RepID=A0A8J8TCZ7_9EURY|nr:hypothetical protein [Halonotius terrestris]TQQ82699.1 hypothetical protein EGH24_04420 [Halonotius terrestris]
MFEISADRATNRLYIDITGNVDREEMEDAADKTLSEAEKLRDGFDIINDLSGFQPPSPEAAEPIKVAQGELQEMGLSRTVRVIDDDTSPVVVNAFERRSRDVGYSGEQADSVDAAETLLEETSESGFD